MKQLVINRIVLVSLAMFTCLLSFQVQAGNVLIIKEAGVNSFSGKSSFEATDHTAKVEAFEWKKVFGVCKVDCVFSGFDGTVTNLTINGKVMLKGVIQVTNSRVVLDGLGEIMIFLGPDFIVLALTADQLKTLEGL